MQQWIYIFCVYVMLKTTSEVKCWRNKCVCDSFLVWANSMSMVVFQWLLSWLMHKWREGYQLPTCRCAQVSVAWSMRELVVVVVTCSVCWVTLHFLARVLCPIGVFVCHTASFVFCFGGVSGTVQVPQLLADVPGILCITRYCCGFSTLAWWTTRFGCTFLCEIPPALFFEKFSVYMR